MKRHSIIDLTVPPGTGKPTIDFPVQARIGRVKNIVSVITSATIDAEAVGLGV